ncbi:MAG: alkaline phosphatase family protein [Thermoplasmata archaeon]|nr:alkaline phosphatase family protein [Thermoplasmata archaeon]
MLIIGLDGVPPELLFDRMADVMPNVRRLLRTSRRAPLRSTDPPLSVPAWPVMFTGVDPGTLGVYGFRHRSENGYTLDHIPQSGDLPVPTLWEILSQRGYRVGVVGMPLGYPPPAINGAYVSDFLTPAGATDTTFPAGLHAEIERRFGRYVFDVSFRSGEREVLADELLAMTDRRFAVASWLLGQEPWDVFAVHEIGTDRLHHAYWKYFDPAHPEFDPENPYAEVARRYYAAVDTGIGRLLGQIDERTRVLIVSDHGAMPMHGCFCINDWLERRGYLVVRQPPTPGTPFEKADVDWSRTSAWGAGGYYARIFFNIRGRERSGAVAPEEVAALRDQLAGELGQVLDPAGRPLGARVVAPSELYESVRGDAPDLMVYFGDLKWRSAGTMGHPDLFLAENDTGPDDAVHGWDGVFVLYDPSHARAETLPTLAIRDVTPTILHLLGEVPPAHVQGRSIPEVVGASIPSPAAP